MTPHPIRIAGPRDPRRRSETTVDTTSRAGHWSSDLSPFLLGPCAIGGSDVSATMENAWQYSKVYPDHVGPDGAPTAGWWRWAREGWAMRRAVRYPRGKRARPAYSYWRGSQLGYVAARMAIYWPLYRDCVAKTDGFRRLAEMAARGPVTLFDFDGYDHDSTGTALAAAILDDRRPMGHAFVLKAMLLAGPEVTAEQAVALFGEPDPRAICQLGLPL